MTLRIDEAEVFRIIDERKPKGIVISTPGGLIRQTRELIDKIRSIYGVPCMLIGDTCYGICDTVDGDVERLDADLAFNIGHNATVERIGDYTYLIEAKDDVKFDSVIERAIPIMRGYRKIGLATFSQHLGELEPVKKRLEAAGFDVSTGRENSLLRESQIFGCDFSTVYPIKDEVDAFCFLGESEFHAVGLALSTDKPTYLLDPYLDEVRDMKAEAEERRRRAILSVYKALDASVFGVITGMKEGQKMLGRSRWITRRLEMHGRKVVQFAMREITAERLAPYRDIDAFVQTACPRISIDGFTFDRPVLSIPQADALVRLLEGREVGEFLQRPKWIELTMGRVRRS
ncbi:MAG: diphthamide synthesis protein [Thaumarchaeota archaeon]|nr:diphthamide synthesis protein [Nitrososphaerota archaeon]